MNMPERTVLITGSSTGFGYHLARGLARAGHRPVATMRGVTGQNAKPAGELEAEGIAVVELDVTSDESVSHGVAEAVGKAGPIDVLVNNAGYGIMGPVETATPDDLRTQFETNVVGAHRMVRAVVPGMRERREGLLVHISSGAGRFALPGAGIYCASKWALEALAEALRYELAPVGVDSVIVEPGPYDTDFSSRSLRFTSDRERMSAYEPVVRGIRSRMSAMERRDPAEVVEAVVRLIDLPRGERPTRTVLHPARPAIERFNAEQSSMTRAMLEQFGVPELLANGV
jgi:NAD(P)-dependent dehydrogenase (short-subunit alcohol dehydrogenase family)